MLEFLTDAFGVDLISPFVAEVRRGVCGGGVMYGLIVLERCAGDFRSISLIERTLFRLFCPGEAALSFVVVMMPCSYLNINDVFSSYIDVVLSSKLGCFRFLFVCD